MSIFHTHVFYPSDVPEMLFCRCGKIKDIHRHFWEKTGEEIVRMGMLRGGILRCQKCGELKSFTV